MTTTLQGVVPILVTPFDETGQIDEESLRSLVAFNLAAGVDGLGVAMGSEIYKLSDAERESVVGIVIDAVAGRVPVVVNTAAAGTDQAVRYSRAAQEAGADAVMVYPPFVSPVPPDAVAAHFRAIDAAIDIAILLQDITVAPVPAPLAMRLSQECRNVAAIKVETQPTPAKVAIMVEAVGDRLTVFGGAGGGYFIEEMRRGGQGTMPFCSQPAAFVEVWRRYRRGDDAGATRIFDETIVPIDRLGAQSHDLYFHVHKQLLVRMGVIRTAHVREPTMRIDPVTAREIDKVLDRIRASGPWA